VVEIRRKIGIAILVITGILGISWIAHDFPGPFLFNLVCYAFFVWLGLHLMRPKKRSKEPEPEDEERPPEERQAEEADEDL